MIALAAVSITGVFTTDAKASNHTEVEVAMSNFRWQEPGFISPGQNFWARDVGNPSDPISHLEFLYIEDMTDTATGGDIVNCELSIHEWDTVVKSSSGFGGALTIALRQEGEAECSDLLGRSGSFTYRVNGQKSPVTGDGNWRMTITGSSGGLEGMTGGAVGLIGQPRLLTVQFNPS